MPVHPWRERLSEASRRPLCSPCWSCPCSTFNSNRSSTDEAPLVRHNLLSVGHLFLLFARRRRRRLGAGSERNNLHHSLGHEGAAARSGRSDRSDRKPDRGSTGDGLRKDPWLSKDHSL